MKHNLSVKLFLIASLAVASSVHAIDNPEVAAAQEKIIVKIEALDKKISAAKTSDEILKSASELSKFCSSEFTKLDQEIKKSLKSKKAVSDIYEAWLKAELEEKKNYLNLKNSLQENTGSSGPFSAQISQADSECGSLKKLQSVQRNL